MTPTELREIVEYAPKDPGPIAPGLVGHFTKDRQHFYCAECVARAARRMGMAWYGRAGLVMVWDNDTEHQGEACDICGKNPAFLS